MKQYNERGPSYYDAWNAAQELLKTHNVRVEVILHCNPPTMGQRKLGHWYALVCYFPADKIQLRRYHQAGLFGTGGTPATLPALIWRSLMELDAKLTEEEDASAQQASF